MKRDLQRLANEPFDLLILGGGINGLATAWDAALRGFSVALVEKGDFGAATSSATLKIVHGGLRYLQHLDLIRTRESVRERSALLFLAPHLVQPMPFLVPTHGLGMQSSPIMLAGLILNEIFSFDRNRNLTDAARRLPMGRILGRRRARELVPALAGKPLSAGVAFYDAQMLNSDRLTLSFALSASEQGAVLANFAEAIALLRDGDRITGARVRDALGGSEFDVRARMTLNMTGPWSDIVLGLLEGKAPERRVLRSKGIQIVLPQLDAQMAFGLPSRHIDPDSLFHRGGRHYFFTPWRGAWLAGTTDTVYEGDPDKFRITDEDISEFVEELNREMPGVVLRREDVRFAFGGLRPITEKNIDTGSTVSRRYEITDHRRDLKLSGLASVVGVKYTTCRGLAEKVVNLAADQLGLKVQRCLTERTRLAGGEIDDIEAFENDAVRSAGTLGENVARHLARTYGTLAGSVQALAREREELARCLPDSDAIVGAEIVHAVREEMALHLDDVVLRRTELGTLGHPGARALQACAAIMAAELGWGAERTADELQRVEACFKFAPSGA